jgi:hypothetical protein
MVLVRYVLPGVLALVGLIFLSVRRDTLGVEMFAMCVGASLSILLLNWLFRLGSTGDGERRAEAEAREHFARHGRWPDES